MFTLFVSTITQKLGLLNRFSQTSTEKWYVRHGQKPLDFGDGLNLASNTEIHRLGRALFLSPKQVFGHLTAKSTDLDKILHAPILRNILVGRLDRDRRVGSSRPNQNNYVFVILVTHPKSYI